MGVSGKGHSAERPKERALQTWVAMGGGGNIAGQQGFLGSPGPQSPPPTAHRAPVPASPCSGLVQYVPPWGSPSPRVCVTDAVFLVLGSAAILKCHSLGPGVGLSSNENPSFHGSRCQKSAIPRSAPTVSFRAPFFWPGGGRGNGVEGGNALVPLFMGVLSPLWGPHPHDLL